MSVHREPPETAGHDAHQFIQMCVDALNPALPRDKPISRSIFETLQLAARPEGVATTRRRRDLLDPNGGRDVLRRPGASAGAHGYLHAQYAISSITPFARSDVIRSTILRLPK